jgi:hypothetical protein
MLFRWRSFRHGFNGCKLSSCENLGLAISQLHHAHRTCRTTPYMPSGVLRVSNMLLSLLRFRSGLVGCPRGLLLPSSSVFHGYFICTDTAHPIELDLLSRFRFIADHRVMSRLRWPQGMHEAFEHAQTALVAQC